MGLFNKKYNVIYAFADGITVPIEMVPDEVFSTKMMGDGIAILPKYGEIYAPCDGRISVVMNKTNHAIGMISNDGMELLIHVGLDTVDLMGEGFKCHVEVGTDVKKGDLLISFDKELLEQKNINLMTMLVITDCKGHSIIEYHHHIEVNSSTSIVLKYK